MGNVYKWFHGHAIDSDTINALFNAPELIKGKEAYDSGNYKPAFDIFESLAKQGNALAQFIVGMMCFQTNREVFENFEEGVKWYRLSAKQGYAEAQVGLAGAYALELGVPFTPMNGIYAYMWYSIALSKASNPPSELHEMLRESRKNLSPVERQKAEDLAKECLASKYQNCAGC